MCGTGRLLLSLHHHDGIIKIFFSVYHKQPDDQNRGTWANMNYAEIARTGSSPKHAWNRRWPSQRKDIAFKAEKHRIHISLPNPRHILNKTPAVKWFRRLGKYLYDAISSVKNTAIALHSFLRRPPKLRMKTLHFHTRSKPLPVIQVFSLTNLFR